MSSEKYTFVKGGLLIDAQLAANDEQRYPLFVDIAAVGRGADQQDREARTRRILELLDESNIGNETYEGTHKVDLEVLIGFERRGYGVFGMMAELNWPSVPDDTASRIATVAMRRTARDTGIYRQKEIPGMVYAQVSRKYGITLETNPAGSSSMDTDGSEYDPASDRVTLHAHNLYTHEMQLICISGMIALAKLK